ncbi:F420-dependent NADP oxidoreductase family protein [Haloferax gibbonsii]|uniref:F420-dependent NADP oxidoreductase family protein n=1 Tax=Haloferax gibbonsii TaxID=35746 RepID=A0A871BBB0_HALGI|nr:NAD(P)-binding domain-containing protein [Haloferax gibbonsii]QOS10437.1 F420-dependent NADP oxidoreductase family protein [Haloferax gibbonsii]
METRRIGIIGSGDVAKALGRGFARHGWDVKVGTRSPDKLRAWTDETAGTDDAVDVGSFAEAATHGDVVVLAVRGDVAKEALDLAGVTNFAGKLVLDATNPLDFTGGEPRLLFGGTDSLGERVQAMLPDASVVKCFNTVSHHQMVDPEFEAETPPMFVCGDDADAKARAEEILTELGWPGVEDAGGIESARYLEALVPLWVRVGENRDTWSHAFGVVQ